MIRRNAAFDALKDDGDRARTLAEFYPGVEKITIFVAFEAADGESDPNYQQIIFTAGSEASFRLDCSRDDCAGGGFDFAPLIDAMMTTEARVHGTLECGGVLGPGEAPCSLGAEYRIVIG